MVAAKLPTPNRNFGYKRAEILAALANGVTLMAISIWIFYEGTGAHRSRRRSWADGCSLWPHWGS
jgi:Co/Zn/Cd efflux system component